jgi:predicted glutamine amidotransferase
MCIIAICHERRMTQQEIENCFTNNSDGAGFAWPTEEGTVHVEKGFMTLEALQEWYENTEIPLPHVGHFRTATSGEKNREMTHPYKMTIDSELVISEETTDPVLFHNGVIFDWKNLLLNMVTSKQIPAMPKGCMNDSRMAAIMSSIPTIGDDIFEVLSGKFVKVAADGTITRWGQFDEVNGILFSNDGHKRVVYVYNKGAGMYNACNYQQNYGKKNRRKGKIIDLTDSEWEEKYGRECGPDMCG